MSREKKKPKQNKVRPAPAGQAATAESENQPHNAKNEAMGPNAKR